jgi:hypothetical protein
MDSYAAYISNQTQHTIKNTKHDVQSKTLCCENDNQFVSMLIKNIPHYVFDILTTSQSPSGLVGRGFHGCSTSVTCRAETTIFWPSLYFILHSAAYQQGQPHATPISWYVPTRGLTTGQLQMPVLGCRHLALCVRETKRCESESTNNNAMPIPDKQRVLVFP